MMHHLLVSLLQHHYRTGTVPYRLQHKQHNHHTPYTIPNTTRVVYYNSFRSMAAMTTGTHKRNNGVPQTNNTGTTTTTTTNTMMSGDTSSILSTRSSSTTTTTTTNPTTTKKKKSTGSSSKRNKQSTSFFSSHSNGNGNTSTSTIDRVFSSFSPSSQQQQQQQQQQQRRNFTVLVLGCVAILGLIQFTLNAMLYNAIDENKEGKQSLVAQLAALQQQILTWQEQTQLYSDDGNFYPFSIRDSRRLVPTQLPAGFHVWDYVDITTQNQQQSKKASLFHNARYEALAPCQKYDLLCYKKKIIQVFTLVLEQNPHTEYFFYMEADNELCTTLTDVRRLAYQYQRYFITTGIGFSGWIMQRQFMMDFIQLLKDFVPPPKDPDDILSQQGPLPSEGPDPIAAEWLIAHQSWTVTRKYLVSHSIQPSLGTAALTVRMPVGDGSKAAIPSDSTTFHKKNQTAAGGSAPAKYPTTNKGLDKHLPRCWEPRRSKWRISKKDHRDRFGWDYFDYDECADGAEVFPCYDGQLQDLLVKDMANFNYTELDAERQKLIEKQKNRQRNDLLKKKGKQASVAGVAGSAVALQQQKQLHIVSQGGEQHDIAEGANIDPNAPLSARLKALTDKARLRHAERLKAGGGGLRGIPTGL